MKVYELLNRLNDMPSEAEVYLKVQREFFNGEACWYGENLEAVDLCDYGKYQAVGLYGKENDKPKTATEVIA